MKSSQQGKGLNISTGSPAAACFLPVRCTVAPASFHAGTCTGAHIAVYSPPVKSTVAPASFHHAETCPVACSSWAQEGCTVPCPPGRHTGAPVCHPL